MDVVKEWEGGRVTVMYVVREWEGGWVTVM